MSGEAILNLLFKELKGCCEKIDFDFERARRELEEFIRDLRVEVIDYFITIDVPSEYFEGTMMDVCILTNKALLGYEVKGGNVSLFHVLPLDRVRLLGEAIRVEKEERYMIASFHFGDLGVLATSAKLSNQESLQRLRKFLRMVSSYIIGGVYGRS
jgi:hypothetical protein